MDMSLYDHFKTRHNKRDNKLRGLTEQKAKEYLYQLLRGLEHLHRNGLFHRDVKPENILIKFPSIESVGLNRLRRYEIIKLADLGSVRGIYSTPPYTEYISTRWYRSPECLLSNGNYGPKMDVWATGCVFYEMITLLPLFPGTNEIDQLFKIHHIIGTPSLQFLNKLKSRSRNCIVFPKIRGTGLDHLMPNSNRITRLILELMIEYDPDKRVNVRRLLKNQYFDDIRYKFEPIMEGNARNNSNNSIEFGKRSNGDLTIPIKPKQFKRNNNSSKDSSSKRRLRSDNNNNSINSTPSIEIPYYSPAPCSKTESNGKAQVLPLIDYKISQYIMGMSRGNSSDSNKNSAKKNSVKKSVEMILRSSRNSESNKITTPKEKLDDVTSRFHSKSLILTKNYCFRDSYYVKSGKRKINKAST